MCTVSYIKTRLNVDDHSSLTCYCDSLTESAQTKPENIKTDRDVIASLDSSLKICNNSSKLGRATVMD